MEPTSIRDIVRALAVRIVEGAVKTPAEPARNVDGEAVVVGNGGTFGTLAKRGSGGAALGKSSPGRPGENKVAPNGEYR